MKLRRLDELVMFHCPGCGTQHALTITADPDLPEIAIWQLSGTEDAPTFWPSVLVAFDKWTPPVTAENMERWRTDPWIQAKVRHVCHSFITEGRIRYLDDCTHHLRGQTVNLPHWNPT